MKPKVNIVFPTINIDTENLLVETLANIGFDVSFTYSDKNKDIIEILFQKEAAMEATEKVVLLLKRFLENVKAHIGVDNDIETAVAFLRGINATCRYLGLSVDDNTRDEIAEKYGFSTISLYPVEELKAKGYNDKDVVKELIRIEFEIWAQRVKKTGRP